MRIAKILLVGVVLILTAQARVAALAAQGYKSAQTIRDGLAVALTEEQTAEGAKTVELASASSTSRFIGITVKQADATTATTTPDSNVFVVGEGEVKAVVSDVNGTVKKGDNLVLSPLKGVLIKASAEETNAVAVALEDQNDENSTTEKVNNRGNSEYETKVSTILIDVKPKAIAPTTQRNSFLILFGESLTGKEVSALQVILAFIIFLLILIIEGSIIYGSIYSSIIALGRNPLSKSAVYKDLVQVTILALAILAAGIVAIYFILWA